MIDTMSWMENQMVWVALITGLVFISQRFLTRVPRHGRDQRTEVWTKLEAVGIPSDGILSWVRAIAGSIRWTQRNVHEGYEKFCKSKDRPFALPTIWTGGAVVVLPPSQIHLLNRPDSEITGFGALLDTIQLPYMIGDRDVYQNVIHFDVVRKKLTRKDIGSLAATTAEEIDLAFRDSWGTSAQWETVNGWDACGRIITRATLRILIGLPLSRDEAVLKTSQLYANSLFAGTAVINCLPPLLRPLIGPLVALPTKYYQKRCQKILVPYVEERIALWRKQGKADDLPVCI